MEFQKKRMNIYGKYLPLIAKFSTDLSGKRKPPNYKKLLGSDVAIEPGSESDNAISEQTAKEIADTVAKDVAVRSKKKVAVDENAQQSLEEFGDSS